MSDTNLAVIGNVIADLINQFKVNITTQPTELFDAVYARKRPPSGERGPKVTAQNSKMTASTFERGGVYPATQNLTWIRPAFDEWAKYVITIGFDEETLEVLRNAGDTHAGNIIAQTSLGAWNGTREECNTDLLTNDPENGGDAQALSGIPHFNDDANIYMNTDRSVVTEWGCVVNDVSGPLSKAALDSAHKSLTHDRRGNYDVICMAPERAEEFVALSGAKITDPARQMNAMDGLDAVLGFRKRGFGQPLGVYNQRPVIEWPGWISTRADGWTPSHLHLEVLKDFAPPGGKTELTKVPGKDLFVAEYTLLAQTVYENPYADSFVLENLS